MSERVLTCAGRNLDLHNTIVMGVLNVTPDSFSDGGSFVDPVIALNRAHEMVEQGAAIIDIGGESTRPGASAVPLHEELQRVIPLIETLARELSVPLSVDTRKSEVMRAAIAAGAAIINDVSALNEPGALEAVAESDAAVCLMHMLGEPGTMQQSPHYEDVVADIFSYLESRVSACVRAGIERSRIIVDPGFGFGKTLQHNLSLLKHLNRFQDLGVALLAGLSRKATIGKLLGNKPADQRLHGSVSAAVIAAWQGAHIVRAHDVAETLDAIKICNAVRSAA